MTSNWAATGGADDSNHRKLDRQTRTEVRRLAARGQRHPQPDVSVYAHQWASDRLQVPLWRELLIGVAGGLVGFAVVLAAALALNQNVGLAMAIALGTIVGICGWILYMRRRVEEVARVNRPL